MITYTCSIPQAVDFNHLLDIMDICDATMSPVKVVTYGFDDHLVEFTFKDMDGYKLFIRNIKEMEAEAV